MIKHLLALALFFAGLAAVVAADEPAKIPNILIAIADDCSYPHMSAYGCTFVHSPNFDRVAREGILFQNCFTSNPKCSPSRACFLTGMHTWQLEEACDHHGIFPAKFKSYPDMLEQQAGYLVGFTGKPWAPGDWQTGGWERNPVGDEFNEFKIKPPTTGISKIDYAKNFEAFLAKRKAGQPFCFWYGGHEPHRPYELGTGLKFGKKLSDAQVPDFLPDVDTVRSDLLDYAVEIEWFDKQLGLMLDTLEKMGELDNTIIIVTADNGMPFPRVKGNPYEMGDHLPLAIRWGAKVKPGRVVTDFINFVDFAPTFLEVIGKPPHPQMTGRGFLDVLLSEKSGRIDATRNFVVCGREREDVGRPGNVGYPVRTIRTDDFLYLRNFKPERWPAVDPENHYRDIDDSPTKSLILEQQKRGELKYYNLAMGKRPPEELYRMGTDPGCMVNLADDPAYAETKKQLSERMEKFLRDQKDPRMFGKGDAFDHYPYVGPALETIKKLEVPAGQ
ncbi:MAG TPA: sulfatase [Chthoniobacter sp.]|jgi:arylsulfatase A-like enzyme